MPCTGSMRPMHSKPIQVPTLTTARLSLTPLSMVHSEGMFEMWQQPAVQAYSGPAQDEHGDAIQLPARTHHDSDKLIRFWIKAARDGWGFRWALTLKAQNRFVGHIGFNSLSQCTEIAYHMNPGYWGHGYMTEAALAALAWRKAGGADEVEAFIEPANSGSIAMALRLGMVATDTFAEGAQRYLLRL